jgi:uncharacterized protein DUF1206
VAPLIGAAPKALARRAFYAAAALFYTGFAVVVVTLILGWDLGGNSDQMARDGTSWLLGLPFGRLLIGAIGLTFVGTGMGIGVAGCQARFRRRIELKKDGRRIVTMLGSFGFAARAVVFATIGFCLLFAAYSSRSSDAKGFAGALRVLQQQPYGAAWLGVLAAGLFAFGL